MRAEIASAWVIALFAVALAACSTPVEGSTSSATEDDLTDSSDSGGDSNASSAGSTGGTDGGGTTDGASGSPSGSGSGASDSGSDSGDNSTSVGGASCDGELHQLTFDVDDAELFGGWQVGWSMSQQREYARWEGSFDNPGDNGVVFHPDIPCSDVWYVWVYFFDEDRWDSFFVQSDGAPAEPALFDGDCDNNNDRRWIWNDLNRRQPGAMEACVYADDPWTQAWGPGAHELRFMYRESIGLMDVIVTNDSNFKP